MRAWLDWNGRRGWIASRGLAIAALGVGPSACIGIEGTDVSTGAAASTGGSTGVAEDDSGTFTSSATDPTMATMGTSADPTDDGESSGGVRLDVGNGESDTTGPLDDGSSSSGAGPTETGSDSSGSDSSGSDSSGSDSSDTGSACGDGEVQLGEDCEGVDLQGQTCISLNFIGGVLACDPTTCLFDTSACV